MTVDLDLEKKPRRRSLQKQREGLGISIDTWQSLAENSLLKNDKVEGKEETVADIGTML